MTQEANISAVTPPSGSPRGRRWITRFRAFWAMEDRLRRDRFRRAPRDDGGSAGRVTRGASRARSAARRRLRAFR